MYTDMTDTTVHSDMDTATLRIPWKLGTLAVLLLLLYAPLYPSLVETWLNDSNNSHGLLIPFVSLYLVWTLKGRIMATKPTASILGLVVLVPSLLLYVMSYVADLAFPARITIITTLFGLVLFNYGWPILKIVLFPLLFLFFMIPVPDSLLSIIAFPLQLFVSDISARLIYWYGIPVYREGTLLHFARYSFEVVEACSGIRSLVSFLAIGTLCVYMMRGTWTKSIILACSTIPLAIGVNIIRVAGAGVLAHYFGNRVAQGFVHDFSGFLVFGLGIILMLGEMWLLNKFSYPKFSG